MRSDGYTPLHLAAKEDQTEIAQLLMKNGAKTDILTLKLSTPLHIAAEYECEAMVNKLLANM